MPSTKSAVLLACLQACLAAGAFAQGPDPAFDDFERAALGPDWGLASPSCAIVGQSDLGTTASGCFAGWTASLFQADQFSEAATALDGDPGMLEQVFVRRRASDAARYGFHWNGDPGALRWELKFDGVPT